jgi:uncharacterized protein (TIGR03118 family)
MKLTGALLAATVTLTIYGCNDNDNDHNGPPPGSDGGNPAQQQQRVARRDLVSDQAGATFTDANLVNAWGLAFNPAGPAWVASNEKGVATVYDPSGMNTGLVVTIPAPGGGTSAPTGQVFNGTPAFMGDLFILSTEDGSIAGWQPNLATAAVTRVDRTGVGAVYKGIAILGQGGSMRLYAADFHNARIDVFNQNYELVSQGNAFMDPQIPAGFAPFNVQAIGDQLFVTYAMVDPATGDDVKGAGNGFVDVFTFDGAMTMRFASGGVLNSPWGVAQAPASFGALSNMILIGNFGDGMIHAFTTAGAPAAAVVDTNGAPVAIDGLWALVFSPSGQLFFTAGPDDEMHGLFGRIDLQ